MWVEGEKIMYQTEKYIAPRRGGRSQYFGAELALIVLLPIYIFGSNHFPQEANCYYYYSNEKTKNSLKDALYFTKDASYSPNYYLTYIPQTQSVIQILLYCHHYLNGSPIFIFPYIEPYACF